MAQATNINERPRTFTAPPAIALVVVLVMSSVVVAALVLTNFSTAATVQPRSEAVLESGREWQRQYEQISGIETRRQSLDADFLQFGRDLDERYKQMTGN